jgi:MYXO-CTERM domain-containing protein
LNGAAGVLRKRPTTGIAGCCACAASGQAAEKANELAPLLLVGYAFAIRSERMLCREVKVNLAYR